MEGLWTALPIIIEVLLPVIGLVVAYLVSVLAKKLGLQNKAQVDFLVESIVRRAVEAVEQLAQVAKKNGEAAIASGDKLAKAIAMVEAELNTLGLPKLASEIIAARVEAYLRNKAEWEEEGKE